MAVTFQPQRRFSRHEILANAANSLMQDSVISELTIDSKSVAVEDISREAVHAQQQFRDLEARGLSCYGAWFRMEGKDSPEVFVPLKIPELDDWEASYTKAVSNLSASNLRVDQTSADEGKAAFRNRVVETLDVRAAAPASILGTQHNPVTVDTNRTGDLVVYTKGFFLSTETGFGKSTPAKGLLPAGRYDFGVRVNGVSQFSGTLWSVPHAGNIFVPLP